MHLNTTVYIRIVALISLALGLSDASRLLGVGHGGANPLGTLGLTGFAYLGILCLSRLFAAVGLWMKSSWGGLVLVASTGWELGLYLLGSRDIHMSFFGFFVRVVLLVAVVLIFVLNVRLRRASVHD